ncbi:sugar phosphate exchanger 2 [Salpingoeca rosetta]|uniref:Sugar phosphate exchanger 2 n=1 Tax=Salpingoeca rosetta (strain ATCC 50818 / BSB-021) TaxID=946362 RepID=F2UPQ4_SALR5|nr:sugar phosphate exchanger 2 [Salpingoeca rosetta]EGD79609.1 sugar phosphate exchanger 2 [Salpingoeca rosetta]|eukprot:XP_004988837.1 sugar phosphate exchanger 2 [Salpingoeca rosetta]
MMGIWNAHTSVGNILGSIIPGAVISYGWGWSFIVPGAIIAFLGILVFFTLVEFPEDLDLPTPEEVDNQEKGESTRLLDVAQPAQKVVHRPIKFLDALRIPGVVEFALSLFFCKLVAYTFLFWLPFYIKHNPVGGRSLSSEESAYLSTLFDAGGILGGTLAGYVSDLSRKPAVVSFVYLIISVPILLVYSWFGADSYGLTVGLLLLCGFFVNGPYALITTAVSADLGTHESLAGNPLALATVTAIIDGTGSIGAALGPYLAGAMPKWTEVFYMLMGSLGAAAVLLVPTIVREVRESRRQRTQHVFIVNQA